MHQRLIIHKSWCNFATKEKKYSSISGFMYVFYGPAAWLVHDF